MTRFHRDHQKCDRSRYRVIPGTRDQKRVTDGGKSKQQINRLSVKRRSTK
jgi:hypothetical protein